MAFLRSELRTEPDCNFQQLAVCNNFCSFWSLCFALLRSSPFRCPLLSGGHLAHWQRLADADQVGQFSAFTWSCLAALQVLLGGAFDPPSGAMIVLRGLHDGKPVITYASVGF